MARVIVNVQEKGYTRGKETETFATTLSLQGMVKVVTGGGEGKAPLAREIRAGKKKEGWGRTVRKDLKGKAEKAGTEREDEEGGSWRERL